MPSLISARLIVPRVAPRPKTKGQTIYTRRKTIVEPVFGQTKEGRGLRRFLLRGLEKVNGEWLFWGTTHNLNKLWRFRKRQRLQQAMATG